VSTPDTGDDTAALIADLTASVAGQVRFDPASRAMWSADASNYRRVPIGVVAPRDTDDAQAAVAVCRAHGVPLLPRGAGTSIAGQAVNTAVVLDFRHLDKILEIDPDARTARVQPGVICDSLRDAARPHGLTFGPDPSTHNRCTLGGMIGNNACGSHSVAWGKTVDNVHALDVLTYRGERLTIGTGGVGGPIPDALRALGERMADDVRAAFPDLTRRVSGYNLDQLLPEGPVDLAKALVGTEGTCATVLGATVRLVESPAARALAVLGFADAYAAADHVMAVREHHPLTIEGMDAGLIAVLRAQHPNETASRALPEGGGWLYVETGGDTVAEAEAAAHAVARAMQPYGATNIVVSNPAKMEALWRIREDGAGIVTRSPDGGEAWPGWEDAAVPPERFGAYLREFDQVLARHGRQGIYYGHFGDGCLHVRIDFDLLSRAGIANFRAFMEDAADAVVSHDGSLSGEHGDGQARSELLDRMYPKEIIAGFEEFKAIWDPDDRMNPGRIVRPAKMDDDLRVFVGMPRLADRPELAFAHDQGSFTRATRRCLGVGRCVTGSGGVMCPSFRATGEEMHSTRGRARLLFEMANGEVITDGWRSDQVAEALDLCLSCKGCKSDCPVGVDMAAYKTEFLAQRYRGRLRPLSHYSMGALPRWLRLVTRVPGLPRLANAAARRPALSSLAKRLAGIAPQRAIPPLAEHTFTRRFSASRAPQHPESGVSAHQSGVLKSPTQGAQSPDSRVVLWPDTFTDHFDPEIAWDAAAVLSALGYQVEIPDGPVCCGLTWYSTGQLDAARRVLRRSVATLRPYLEDGVPIIALEPSCAAALRADLPEVLPSDPGAAALAGAVRTLAEVLAEHTDELATRVRERGLRALVQLHCHQHADLGAEADRAVLKALQVDAEVLDSGCCGLAGNFGFEKGHYDVSMACAERVLLPAPTRTSRSSRTDTVAAPSCARPASANPSTSPSSPPAPSAYPPLASEAACGH
jgi:FAD/FMN-containing dehydrogenase/Fe-S oxidoreductase